MGIAIGRRTIALFHQYFIIYWQVDENSKWVYWTIELQNLDRFFSIFLENEVDLKAPTSFISPLVVDFQSETFFKFGLRANRRDQLLNLVIVQ